MIFHFLLLMHVCMGRLSLWQEWAFALKSLPVLSSILNIAAFLVSSSVCMFLKRSLILLGLRNGRLNFVFLLCFIMIYGIEDRFYCLIETLSNTGLKRQTFIFHSYNILGNLMIPQCWHLAPSASLLCIPKCFPSPSSPKWLPAILQAVSWGTTQKLHTSCPLTYYQADYSHETIQLQVRLERFQVVSR